MRYASERVFVCYVIVSASATLRVDIVSERIFYMGSTGSGRFTDYTGVRDATGQTGGESGTDKCELSFSCILEDVGQASSYSTHGSLPTIGTTVLIQLGQPRIVAVHSQSGLECGALPTQFNYLAACMNDGHSYVGIVTRVTTTPLPLIQLDVRHI